MYTQKKATAELQTPSTGVLGKALASQVFFPVVIHNNKHYITQFQTQGDTQLKKYLDQQIYTVKDAHESCHLKSY